jgi:hypothetical protein
MMIARIALASRFGCNHAHCNHDLELKSASHTMFSGQESTAQDVTLISSFSSQLK